MRRVSVRPRRLADAPLLTWADKRNPQPYRGPRPKTRSETSIQQELVRRLKALEKLGRTNPGWFWTCIPSGLLLSTEGAGYLSAMGVRPGWPDLFFSSPEGRPHGLELKRPGGQLSSAQEAIAAQFAKAGGAYLRVESVAAAEAYLRKWGFLRPAL